MPKIRYGADAYALAHHGSPRYTGDIDLFVNPRQVIHSVRILIGLLNLWIPAYFLPFVLLLYPSVLRADVPVPVGNRIEISSAPGELQGKPAIASDGNNFFIVWRDARNYGTNSWDIYGARISPDGTVLDPDGIAISTFANIDPSPGNQYFPSVAFDGTNFVVVWIANRSGNNGSYQVVAARVATDGTVLDPNGVTVTADSLTPLRMPSIAFDGTNFLVTWRTAGSEIRVIRMSPALVNLDDQNGFLIGTGFYPYVAFDGTNYMVTWHGWGVNGLDIFGAVVSTAGQVLDPGVFTISSLPGDEDHGSIAFDGANYFAVWHNAAGGNAYNGAIYGARISPAGTVLDNPAIKVADYGFGEVAVKVVFDGADFFVVWHADQTPTDFRFMDIFGRRVTADGLLYDKKETTPVATFFANQGWAPVLAYDNGRYLVAWGEPTGVIGSNLKGRLLQRQELNLPAPTGSPQGPTAAGWSPQLSPASQALHAIWGFDQDNVYAVGEGSALYKFNGDQWTNVAAILSTGRGFGLWGFNVNDVWAIGWAGQFANFNGTDVPLSSGGPLESGYALWGETHDSMIAVGVGGGILKIINAGSEWQSMESPTFVDLYDVWGSAPNNVYAVGGEGVVLHYDGDAWTRVQSVPSIQSLNGIWGSGADDIFIVGDFGTILHFDGEQWSVQDSGTSERLSDVFGFNATHVYAVGANGTILRYDGSNWIREQSNTEQSLEGVWGGDNKIWVVGDNGIIHIKVDTDLDGSGDLVDADDDDDGMSDAYEIENGLNSLDNSDAALDKDADGLSNLTEFQLGSSANNTDSDSDGMGDKAEVDAGRNPAVNEAAIIQIINSTED